MTAYLLGATTNREIVFADFGIETRNGYPEFTASFDCVRPFTADEVDATEYYENLIECMDVEWRWQQCEHYDCKPSELAETLAEEEGTEPQDFIDCSCYPEIIDVDGTDYYFESRCGGQHDTREEGMEAYTDKNLYDQIHKLWDKYHLKEVGQDVIKEVEQIKQAFVGIDEVEWIKGYIKAEFQEGVK